MTDGPLKRAFDLLDTDGVVSRELITYRMRNGIMKNFIKEMREFIKQVWDELEEKTVEELVFDVMHMNPFIPTVKDTDGNDDWDLTFETAIKIINDEYNK